MSDKKYTVVTGASSGIGYAAAKAFAARGKNLIVTARREAQLARLREEIAAAHPDVDVVIRTADLSVPENAHRLYDELRAYEIETWVNNAGFGSYGSVAEQDTSKIESMLRLNVGALTILSTLFVHDYRDAAGAQLINISSCGGYTIVPTAVTYCATKFYVSAFTEGLAQELIASGAKLRAKALAPAATRTEFGKVANDAAEYDYDARFGTYHTAEQMADFLLRLYDSDKILGRVNRETYEFELTAPLLPYAGNSSRNQKQPSCKR